MIEASLARFGRIRFAGLRGLFAPLALVLLLAACDSVEDRIAEHYERGQKLLQEGSPEKAVLEFSNALQLDAEHVPSLFAIAGILEKRGDLKGAFGHYGKVAELDPKHATARLKLARFYMLGNAMDKAKTELAAALENAPDEAEAHALAAVMALREGDDPAAKAALEKAQALAPMNAEVLLAEIGYLRKTAGAAQALARTDEAIAAHAKVLSFYVLKLQMLEQQDDQAGMGAHLAAMIEAFPDQARFRQARAQWAFRNDDLATAEAELRAIVTAKPDNREAVTTLIRFLHSQHGRETARAELAGLIERVEDTFPLELMLAQFDVQTGQTDAAITYLYELIERAGDKANEARILLARLLMRQDKKEDAYKLVDAILEEDPNHVQALVLHVARLIDAEDLDVALQAARRGLTEAPDNVALLLLAGRIHELSGNLNLASDRYAKAVRTGEYEPSHVGRYVRFLMRDNRVEAAMTVLTEAVERRPGEARLLDLLASLRLRARDWTGAEAAIAALEKKNPDRAKQLRGALLIGQERFDEGTELLRDLPENERQRSTSITALVQTYLREGKVDEAKAFLDELIAKDPTNTQALGLRGNLHLAEGAPAAARATYEKILEIDPKNVGAYSALARLIVGEDDHAGAEQILEKGLTANADHPLLLLRLAGLKERSGDVDTAIELYGRAYERAPDSLVAANNLASLLADYRAGDPASIDRAYRVAGRLRNATSPYFRDTYGWTRHLKGEHKEALEHLSATLEALPKHPWVHYHVGMTQAALGNTEEARKHLEKALDLGGTAFPPAAKIQETLAGLQ